MRSCNTEFLFQLKRRIVILRKDLRAVELGQKSKLEFRRLFNPQSHIFACQIGVSKSQASSNSEPMISSSLVSL